MKNYTIKDVMVPLSEYATVPEGASLHEAVMALEKAQEQFDRSKYHHRAVLILDKQKRVIGKINQFDVLRAIEPKSEKMAQLDDINQFGFSERFISETREQYRLESAHSEDISKVATNIKVEDVMQSPSEGEYIEENESLETAIHQLVMGSHLSLLVIKEKDIVGVLRISDVFAAVFHELKSHELKKKRKRT